MQVCESTIFSQKDNLRNWRTNDSPRNQLLKINDFLGVFFQATNSQDDSSLQKCFVPFWCVVKKVGNSTSPQAVLDGPGVTEGQRLWWRAARRSESADGCRTALWCRECFCCLAAGGRCFFFFSWGSAIFEPKYMGGVFFGGVFLKYFARYIYVHVCICSYMYTVYVNVFRNMYVYIHQK